MFYNQGCPFPVVAVFTKVLAPDLVDEIRVMRGEHFIYDPRHKEAPSKWRNFFTVFLHANQGFALEFSKFSYVCFDDVYVAREALVKVVLTDGGPFKTFYFSDQNDKELFMIAQRIRGLEKIDDHAERLADVLNDYMYEFEETPMNSVLLKPLLTDEFWSKLAFERQLTDEAVQTFMEDVKVTLG